MDPGFTEEDVEELLALLDWEFPDEADQFEDRLAERLGAQRHPALSYDDWRVIRVKYIEGADQDRADELAAVVEEELTGRPSEPGTYSAR